MTEQGVVKFDNKRLLRMTAEDLSEQGDGSDRNWFVYQNGTLTGLQLRRVFGNASCIRAGGGKNAATALAIDTALAFDLDIGQLTVAHRHHTDFRSRLEVSTLVDTHQKRSLEIHGEVSFVARFYQEEVNRDPRLYDMVPEGVDIVIRVDAARGLEDWGSWS